MLFVGLQFIIWSISGTYMVLMDIHYIHGDKLIANNKTSISSDKINYSIKSLLNEYPEAKSIKLGLLLDKAVYRFSDANNKVMLSAEDGQRLSSIKVAAAIKIARQHYVNKDAQISAATLITQNPPRELSSRLLPVWRIDFDDFASPTFYISANSAELVTKRHSFWRIFDWMFAFHVMDYIDESADNKLLLITSVLAILASIFGVVLTYYRLAPIQTSIRRKR